MGMMSRSIRLKGRHEKSSVHSLHDCDEGSAARTRPFSFEEIMLRRENKKSSENVKELPLELVNIRKEGSSKNVSDIAETERGYKPNKDSSPIVEKNGLEKSVKGSSRVKEENSSMKKDALVKGKDRETHKSDGKLKHKQNTDIRYAVKQGIHDRQTHGRRKNDEKFTDDSANETEMKHSRGLATRVGHADGSRGKSERESKRKYRNGNDERDREWNAAQKHDFGKQRDLDISERKERKDSSQSHYEDSRSKRRRSRSREREKRSRKSISLSPRAHKHKFNNDGEHREFSSHSLQERSGRQHSDSGRTRLSNNGSSSHYQRRGGYRSGLGGYSPRKKRIEAAIKTSSPSGSPEKRSAGWDLPPVGTAGLFSGSVPSNLQLLNQNVASSVSDMSSAVSVASITLKSLPGVTDTVSTRINAHLDSVQLTQATRPMRRLCVENIPSSASEKDVMECLNNFLLSSGVNHIKGTQACFNCIVSVTLLKINVRLMLFTQVSMAKELCMPYLIADIQREGPGSCGIPYT